MSDPFEPARRSSKFASVRPSDDDATLPGPPTTPALSAVPQPVDPSPDDPPARSDETGGGVDPAGESAPMKTAAKTRARKTPKAAAKPAGRDQAQSAKARGADPTPPPAGTAAVPTEGYEQDPSEPRVKDWGMMPKSLMDHVEMMRMQWTLANMAQVKESGTPHNSGFREALVRLGLKHINDPEFASLIPPDRRRGRNRRDLDSDE